MMASRTISSQPVAGLSGGVLGAVGHLQQEGEALQAEPSAGDEGAADLLGAAAEVAELRQHDGHVVGARDREHLRQPLLLPGWAGACSTVWRLQFL